MARDESITRNSGETFYTPPQVATRLGVDANSVRRLIKSGKIRALRFGKTSRVPAGQVEILALRLMAERKGYSIPEIARRLNITRATIEREIEEGRLQAHERFIGRGVVVFKGEFERWVASKLEQPGR